jgi:amino acid adenylation domain-containing protein
MSNSTANTGGLSAAKRALLELRLKQKASTTHTGTIPKLADRPASIPLSFAQQRLWFLDQFYPGSFAYNVPRAVRLKGKLDVQALQKSLDAILTRHEVLRTTFQAVNGEPVQIVAQDATLTLRTLDLTGDSHAEAMALGLAQEEVRRPFTLSADVMLRATLLRLSEQDHILVLVTHHIASDGWSRGVLFRELSAFYHAFQSGTPALLAELPIQYADFAIWQREWMQGETLQTQLAYWKDKLVGLPALLELPTDRPRPAVQSYQGAKQFPTYPKALLDGLRELSRREGATLFMTLLAAYQTLLWKYSRQEDIVVGTPIAGRNRPEMEPLIGDFVNMLVLRTDLSGDPSFRELLRRVRGTSLEAYDNQELPFEKLVEELERGRDLSRSPLFQVMFALENMQSALPQLPGLEVSVLDLDTGSAKNDLILSLKEGDAGLKGKIEYNCDLFESETIARFSGHFQKLLEGIVTDPERKVGSLPLLTESERRQVVSGWNSTQADYDRNACIHSLFEAAVARNPDAIAVRLEDQQLAYRELNVRANQLAHYLRTRGVGPDSLVGLCVERSLDLVVGLLGIMKAGGAYVPLDPIYPKDRRGFMVEDARVRLLLTQKKLLPDMPANDAEVICLDQDWERIAQEPAGNPQSGVRPENLSYVIFTSGSTGRPKGVQLEHRNVVNFLTSVRQRPGLSEKDVYLGVASMSFDASVLDFYLPLTTGACLALVTSDTIADGRALAERMRRFGVTAMHATPASWRLLLDSGWQGDSALKVFCGGEALSWDLAQHLLPRCSSLWNLYGPTETAVYSTIHQVRVPDGKVFVGAPIANTQIFVVDGYLQPAAIGVPGELCIGGDGVARGYLNRPELTAEKFVADPFVKVPGARVYRTGDLVRRLPDGNIVFLGRMDHQVKLRGFRIELGEVEAVLAQHAVVRHNVVVAREDVPGDKRLVAYLVAQPGQTPDVHELRRSLKEKLPEYMVPSAFVVLESIPLSPNGKVNRNGLPLPDGTGLAAGEHEFVAPATPFQKTLAEIWSRVLRNPRIGIHDNFFELGGHSLLATQVVSRVRDQFQVELSPRMLFENPTVAGLADVIGQLLLGDTESENLASLLAEVESITGNSGRG